MTPGSGEEIVVPPAGAAAAGLAAGAAAGERSGLRGNGRARERADHGKGDARNGGGRRSYRMTAQLLQIVFGR